MKICLIGKYPPIEGGVSVNNYWTAYGLAELGHEVYVVTNSGEVEEAHRIYLTQEDDKFYQPEFAKAKGFVQVFQTERFNAAMSYIPLANPFVSKLASLATQVIRQYGCDIIYACYFEPYAVAGYLASLWSDVPLLINHAGSDLERLMRVPQLATTYKEILRSAAGVITIKHLADRFVGMGVRPERIYYDPPFSLPKTFFNPRIEPLDVEGTLKLFASEISPANKTRPHETFKAKKPTIGVYGKVGEHKGSYDLVQALGLLKHEGLDFNFLAMVGGWHVNRFRSAVEAGGLDDRTWLMPFLPHWKVAQFIRACTATCFLERDFPIAIHGPVVPREVLACGGCLVISGEIATKQPYCDEIVDRENMLVVPDPKDHTNLAAALRLVITEPERAFQIGARGHALSEKVEGFRAYAREFEAMLEDFLQKTSAGHHLSRERDAQKRSAARADEAAPFSSQLAELAETAPVVRSLLHDNFEALAKRFINLHGDQKDNRFGRARDFCRFIQTQMANEGRNNNGNEYDLKDSVLRYQIARLCASFDEDESLPAFPLPNALGDQPVSKQAVRNLRPFRSSYSRVETFAYDVTLLFQLHSHTQSSMDANHFRDVEKRTTHVCFHKPPNLNSKELKINEATASLLALCDGTRDTLAVVQNVGQMYGVSGRKDFDALWLNSLEALRQLYEAGVIIFA